MADLEDRVATLESQMEIQGARDSATLTVVSGKLVKLDRRLGRVQEAVTNLALKHEELAATVEQLGTTVEQLGTTVEQGFERVDTKLDEVLRRLPPPQE
ncbi:hypothetical protein AB0H76_22710 [Nocardia sp. NPDC050712]|uniref:hypothetical protein n=1 Tax=Nocardia sp. NPDC050712 TaxID=3155518 RepID=UPI0033EAC44B